MTSCFTPEQINKINRLVKEIEELSDVEKLFLYLQLPCGLAGTGDEVEVARCKSSNLSSTRGNGNVFARKLDQETTQTYTWILSHLEVDQNVSLPKQEVYDEYKSFCQANKFEPLCVADFGKAMKHTFPCIKPRRLGHRGNSRYCYSGLRKKYKIMAPSWPEITDELASSSPSDSAKALHSANQVTEAPLSSGNSSSLMFDGKSERGCSTEAARHEDQTSHHNKNGIEMMGLRVSQCPKPHRSKMFINQETDVVQTGPASTGNQPNPPIGTNNISPATHNEQQAMFSCNQPYFNYNYSQTVHQPGSPDDDDYQHNYQHNEVPMIRQYISKSSTIQVPVATGVTCNHLCQQQQQHPQSSNVHENSIQVGYSRVQQVGQPETTSSTATPHQQTHDPMLPQTNFCLDNSGPSSSSPATSTNTMNTYTSLSRLNGSSHMDTYASPFQSPASTPYPSISSNYINHDSQDYFSCDLMQHYTSS